MVGIVMVMDVGGVVFERSNRSQIDVARCCEHFAVFVKDYLDL